MRLMEDPRWLRFVTAGLVLVALAIGYFLLAGRFTSDSTKKAQNQIIQATPTPQPTIIPDTTTSLSTPPAMAAARRNITTLPRTGYPQALLIVIAVGVIISGLGLRKFPN